MKKDLLKVIMRDLQIKWRLTQIHIHVHRSQYAKKDIVDTVLGFTTT